MYVILALIIMSESTAFSWSPTPPRGGTAISQASSECTTPGQGPSQAPECATSSQGPSQPPSHATPSQGPSQLPGRALLSQGSSQQASTPSGPASGPASSPASGRATPSRATPSQERQRARLTDEEKLVLVRLCVNYQEEHTRGNNLANFWIKIKQLLKDETGKELKNPQDTIRLMTTALEVQDRRELRESGTVQQDTDLNQALRQWLEHENDAKDQEKRKKSAAEEAAQREAEEAENHRRNLLLPNHKHSTDKDDSESSSLSDNTKAVRRLKKRRQNKRKEHDREEIESRRLREDMGKVGKDLSDSIKYLADKSSSVAGPSVVGPSVVEPFDAEQQSSLSISQIDAKFDRLEKEFESQSRRTNAILERLTSLLETSQTLPPRGHMHHEDLDVSAIDRQLDFETQG